MFAQSLPTQTYLSAVLLLRYWKYVYLFYFRLNKLDFSVLIGFILLHILTHPGLYGHPVLTPIYVSIPDNNFFFLHSVQNYELTTKTKLVIYWKHSWKWRQKRYYHVHSPTVDSIQQCHIEVTADIRFLMTYQPSCYRLGGVLVTVTSIHSFVSTSNTVRRFLQLCGC